jgi:hypothetical protein
VRPSIRIVQISPLSSNRTAKFWSEILGLPVTPEQVALCMIAVKMSREVNAHKRDNLVDIAGYARTLETVKDLDQRP